jgi:hypothetical protein
MRLLTAAAGLAALAGLACATAQAANVSANTTIPTTSGATWYLNNGSGSATGALTGTCGSAPGLAISDAQFGGRGDAYDIAWSVYVNGTPYVAPGDVVDLVGTTVTGATVRIAGLDVGLQYHFIDNSGLARILATFRNPGTASVTANVQVPVNFGSDGGSRVNATSSGDTSVSAADRWMVTSDGGPSDPVLTNVFYGPGSPAVRPATYSQTVHDCAGPQGLGASFDLTVAPGQTRALMFFAGLNGITTSTNTVAAAQAGAALFDAAPRTEWLAGLSGTQQGQVANWDLDAFTTCAAEGFGGTKLTLCQKICEIDQPSSTLSALIRFWTATYRTDPPCAD